MGLTGFISSSSDFDLFQSTFLASKSLRSPTFFVLPTPAVIETLLKPNTVPLFQKWEEDDYRMVRFVGKTKVVNENWAAKLIDSVPPENTKKRVVSCDGGGGPTGHPKVYINLV